MGSGDLRQFFLELRSRRRALALQFTEKAGGELFQDVWAARDAYIDVILDRSQEGTDRFFAEHQHHVLSSGERVQAISLMEMQRHTQLMYTSCGWFFDDISGIETVQIIAYAARVIQLSKQLFGQDAAGLEPAFLETMEQAKSNVASLCHQLCLLLICR
jgi:alpha-amylase/alpha-mannosidase (GH57 family)